MRYINGIQLWKYVVKNIENLYKWRYYYWKKLK